MSGNFQVSNSFLQFQITFKIVSKSSFKFALIGEKAISTCVFMRTQYFVSAKVFQNVRVKNAFPPMRANLKLDFETILKLI